MSDNSLPSWEPLVQRTKPQGSNQARRNIIILNRGNGKVSRREERKANGKRGVVVTLSLWWYCFINYCDDPLAASTRCPCPFVRVFARVWGFISIQLVSLIKRYYSLGLTWYWEISRFLFFRDFFEIFNSLR